MNRGLVLGLTILLCYWGLSLLRTAGPDQARNEDERPMPPVRSISSEAQSQAPIEASRPTVDPVTNSVTVPSKTAAKPFAFQRQLDTFSKLNQKVFLTDEEKAQKAELLRDPNFLRALADRLVEPSIDPSVTAGQDAAVDLLLEAVKGGDKQAAAEALTEVVEDAQVESSALAQPIREQLAGIKGEVLYHWSALDPSQSAHIASRLPGPVSQRIWQNVRNKQASNQNEI